MNDDQLLRYSRHILLTEFGVEGQQRLLASHALVIGAGGLGSPVALYLASAGVGRITLCDADTVDLTNLQRQIIHRTASVGSPKVESARGTMLALNPEINVVPLAERITGERMEELVSSAEIVVDCSDNFATRHALNRACVKYATPLVSGAAVRFDGQVSVYDFREPGAACYACLFPEEGENEDMPCAVMGVFAPVTGIVGTIQAAETLKLLAGIGETLSARLLLLDALTMQIRIVRITRDERCSVCSAAAHA
jgi:molybdopterin-synthase adenylyltransferase